MPCRRERRGGLVQLPSDRSHSVQQKVSVCCVCLGRLFARSFAVKVQHSFHRARIVRNTAGSSESECRVVGNCRMRIRCRERKHRKDGELDGADHLVRVAGECFLLQIVCMLIFCLACSGKISLQ